MFLYVIGNKSNRQKIGFSKNVEKRLKTLQTGNSEELLLHYYVQVPEHRVRILEKKIHLELSYKRLKGEWFDISADDAKQFLDFAMIRWLDDNLI
jgi:predicted GIY-YIG superfamily endonuclease